LPVACCQLPAARSSSNACHACAMKSPSHAAGWLCLWPAFSSEVSASTAITRRVEGGG
jgi:hypothetical protein